MNQYGRAGHEYLKNAVMTASNEQLHLMLVDGAIRFALRGREAIEQKEIESAYHALERSQRIVLELMQGMRRDANPELVDQMGALYDFVYRRLVDANIQRQTQPIDEAVSILRFHRETWVMLMEKLAREAAAASPATPPAAPGAQHVPAAIAQAAHQPTSISIQG